MKKVEGEAHKHVALLDELRTAIHAISVPTPPALHMFFFAAFLDDNVRAYHLTTVRAVPDWGVGAPVIQVRTPFSLHCADPLFLPSSLPLSGSKGSRVPDTEVLPRHGVVKKEPSKAREAFGGRESNMGCEERSVGTVAHAQ